MASFAELDENNYVINLMKVNNDAIGNLEYPDSEEPGIEFLQDLFGPDKIYKQYSINTRGGVHYTNGIADGSGFRKNHATIGGLYDESRDAFVQKSPFASWTFNETSCIWEPPVPQPDCEEDEGVPLCYAWNEDRLEWVKITSGDTGFINLVSGSVGPIWPTGSMKISAV
jgi:hypothetical protein